MSDPFKTVIIGPPGSKLPHGTKIDDAVDVKSKDRVIDLVETADVDRTPLYFLSALGLLLAAGMLAVAGVYVLFGLGCSLLAGAASCAGAGYILMRGLSNAQT